MEPLSFNQARVVRLISTNPADYLAGPYQPGAVLEFAPPERL
ncbi:YlzJ-like family protein [Moorella stamsii]